jgi:hypothetical protein
MRRIAAIALIVCLPLFAGCRWFVPGAVKQESAIIRVDVENCQKEMSALQSKAVECRAKADIAEKDGDTVTAADERAKALDYERQVSEKAMRSYKRVTPHVVNMDNYMTGKDSKGNK